MITPEQEKYIEKCIPMDEDGAMYRKSLMRLAFEHANSELLEAREALRLCAKCDGGCARYECVCHTKIALKFLNNWSEK